MISSIRKFLLIYILIGIGFITFLSALGDYYLSQTEVRAHMDRLLEQMGLSFATVISTNLEGNANLQKLETELTSIENESRYFFLVSNNKTRDMLFTQTKYYFQLWDDQGKLLLYSAKAAKINLDVSPTGLSDQMINGELWRLFRIYDPEKHVSYVVGERYAARDQLLHRITINNFYIMLVSFPFFAFLIWIIVGIGFKSVQRITDEVSNRAFSYLEPVDIKAVPYEIQPLVEELNSLFSRLHEAFEREKRFAADAAHELRTPLAALKTQVQVALKTVDETERETLFQHLIPSVDRIVHIVQQLLTLSRLVPEATNVYEVLEVNLSKITAEIIAQLVPMALEKNIEIALEAPQSVYIKGNLTGISILIRNLVDNAIRYTPENGKVNVAIYENQDYVVFRVVDTGPGIPEELRARVFERFYRVIGNNVAGSGLGLAIVEQIAQLHQASVKLMSPKKSTGLIVEVQFIKLKMIS